MYLSGRMFHRLEKSSFLTSLKAMSSLYVIGWLLVSVFVQSLVMNCVNFISDGKTLLFFIMILQLEWSGLFTYSLC